MQFRLSTLMIVVTALTILAAQYPYVYELGYGGEGYGIHAPTPGFIAVGLTELALGIAWPMAKRGKFAWRPVLAVGVVCQIALTGLAMLCRRENTVGDAIFLLILAGILVAAAIGALYAAFAVIKGIRSLFGYLEIAD